MKPVQAVITIGVDDRQATIHLALVKSDRPTTTLAVIMDDGWRSSIEGLVVGLEALARETRRCARELGLAVREDLKWEKIEVTGELN